MANVIITEIPPEDTTPGSVNIASNVAMSAETPAVQAFAMKADVAAYRYISLAELRQMSGAELADMLEQNKLMLARGPGSISILGSMVDGLWQLDTTSQTVIPIEMLQKHIKLQKPRSNSNNGNAVVESYNLNMTLPILRFCVLDDGRYLVLFKVPQSTQVFRTEADVWFKDKQYTCPPLLFALVLTQNMTVTRSSVYWIVQDALNPEDILLSYFPMTNVFASGEICMGGAHYDCMQSSVRVIGRVCAEFASLFLTSNFKFDLLSSARIRNSQVLLGKYAPGWSQSASPVCNTTEIFMRLMTLPEAPQILQEINVEDQLWNSRELMNTSDASVCLRYHCTNRLQR